MTNSDNGGLLAQEIILTIAREYGWPGPKPTEKVPVTLDRDALEGVTGTYQPTEKGVPVTLDRDALEGVTGTYQVPEL